MQMSVETGILQRGGRSKVPSVSLFTSSSIRESGGTRDGGERGSGSG